MNYAIKLQATAGSIIKFDCTGGEPNDTHKTIAEMDPADSEFVEKMDSSISDYLESNEISPNMTIGDLVNHVLAISLPEFDVPVYGKARLQIRKMDSDGRA